MNPQSRECPPEVVQALRAYIDEGVPLGDFLQAVVEDRLVESFKRADDTNLEAMPHIVAWIYWEMPTDLRGQENYKDHIRRMAEKRAVEVAKL